MIQLEPSNIRRLAGIEYLGSCGITASCLDSIKRLIQFGDRITHARILSCSSTHCFLLTVNHGTLVAVKSGFSSGYPGEGPKGLSHALRLMEAHGAEIEEYTVKKEIIDRLNLSALRKSDIAMLQNAVPLRPCQWHDYIWDKEIPTGKYEGLWEGFPPVIPLALIDSRIVDLTLNFWTDPDAKLIAGYRRLEQTVRERIGTNEIGAKLFAQAFNGDDAHLVWADVDKSEQTARAGLFTSAYRAYRNRRVHGESKFDAIGCVDEFLVLNHLYRLERNAINRKN